jgi:endonuclease/exonuclease/phosphatase family metal-dependent hydrolase
VRLLVYNIRYATGTGPSFHLPLPGAGYLRSNRKVLDGITDFIRHEHPDVVGLIEVDTGSIRTGMVNQAEHIAGEIGHYSTFQCKYGTGSVNNFVPIVRKQANAFLSAPHVHGERFHYFDTGIKRLIIELELDDVCVFLVHLSLKFRHRQYQLRSLHDLIVQSPKPVIVAGDFNTFWGTHEIYLFMRAAGLRSANSAGLPSFPAKVPRVELDFILVSEGIEVTDFRVPDVRFSDHRPLVCDFHVPPGAAARRTAAA